MACEPPRLGRREARDLLANKTVAFVGDSVSRMMFCETAAWLFGVKGWWWPRQLGGGSAAPHDPPDRAAADRQDPFGFTAGHQLARGVDVPLRAAARALLLWRDDATAGDAAARRDAGGEEQFDVDRHRAVGGARRRVVCAGGPLVHRPPVARGRLMVDYTE